MLHTQKIVDDDPIFEINEITRDITDKSSSKTMLMQFDHNSERFTFKLPRYIENHDMLECNAVEVHFINADKERGVYGVTDLSISPDDETMLVCSWLISQNATKLQGSLSFLLRFKCIEADGRVSYIWSTKPHLNVSVGGGYENTAEIIEQYPDIIAMKVDKVQGKGLSSNDYTDDDKKLLYILQEQQALAIMPENLINISYLFSEGRNEGLRERLDTSYAEVMNYTYRKFPYASVNPLVVRADNCISMQNAFNSASCKTVEFKTKDGNGTPKLVYANHIFFGCSDLTNVTGLDCTNVTTLKYAFTNSTALESVNLVSTENVTDLSYAFYNSGLTEISGLNTSKVTNLDGAFAKSKVISLTLDCPNVTTAKGSFTDCTELTFFTLKNISDETIMKSLFNSLPETVNGTFCIENCVFTSEISAIAYNKGWKRYLEQAETSGADRDYVLNG